MRHLVVCKELPPAPSGGIGTYAQHIARLLSARPTETVHVIGPLWEGADRAVETGAEGRLVVHRVPYRDWSGRGGGRPHPSMDGAEARALLASDLPAQAFSWQAGLLAERLVEEEAIDVIEAEDYEAPLYFFLLRRALGLGPERTPPCIVHLHSPTRFIARHNGRGGGAPEVVAAKRLEDYCIGAADALLCPSRYLARQAEAEYGLPSDSVQVIPLPVGDTPELARDPSVWSTGSVAYLGRLERRKGIVEWLEAAARVARERPDLSFDFVGGNVLGATPASGAAILERLVPADLRPRFRFHGHRDRAGMLDVLRGARMAVVPSRWENFPNTCVEAMSSGLPVLATREGGMAEMIEDGASGWLTASADADALEAGLRRAVVTPPARLAVMGAEAARRIRTVCDNERTTERHLRFRKSVHERGAGRSLVLPVNLPWAGAPLGEPRSEAAPGGPSAAPSEAPPRDVVAVVTTQGSRASASAMNEQATAWVREHGTRPLAFLFTSEDERIDPDFLPRCADVFRQCPEVGLVGAWTADPEPSTPPCPAFPYQWLANDVCGPFAVRAAAFDDAGGFRKGLGGGLETWDLVNAVMASGWVAVNLPRILSHRAARKAAPALSTASDAAARRTLLERFPKLVARDATELVVLLESDEARSVRQALELIRAELDAVGKGEGSNGALPSRMAARLAGLASGALARALSWVGGPGK